MNKRARPLMARSNRIYRALALGVLLCLASVASLFAVARVEADTPEEEAAERALFRLPPEQKEDPPASPAKALPGATVANSYTFGRFTAIQVSVNALGQNIANDAANEPSLAVDPTNHNRMVIGWRQFDNVASNFRQAGFGYTTNAGATWTASKIQPGVFHSDPVLEIDSSGDFFYNGLNNGFTTTVFQSTNGGVNWNSGVPAAGGDKQWMTIDRGLDYFYQAWSTAASSTGPNTFNRSLDDGASFAPASSIPHAPIWGTLDVSLDHTLYLVGWGDGTSGDICVSRSLDAQEPEASPPLFVTVPVDLGGFLTLGGPNPDGLLGQLWIAVDRSNGPRSGWVYVLASVETPTDPVDVHFIRSTDHGVTWSAPVRVNDDAVGNGAYQWFGTMSVAPNGRIDAVWNDTRQSLSDFTISALYYSYSLDGGTTWSPNEQCTPFWISTLGWPNQQKIGDYYDMTSDDTGADLAFSATLTGGQDVFYMRIPFVPPVGVTGGPPARLLENSPNPFASSTTIRFDAPSQGARVLIDVFDVAGHRVATLVDRFVSGAGQSVSWDGRLASGAPAPPGVYFCRLAAGSHTEMRKLLRVL
jgi:hypothetical protein